MGRACESVRVDDLGPVDEFHTGGRQATIDLLDQLALRPGSSVLDIGSGIGGTARLLVERYGCSVTGIDPTPEFVTVAEALTHRVGLTEKARFRIASATDLPFDPHSFDAATLLHVGMNVPDKVRLFFEGERVLKPGGNFAIYDMMRVGDGDLEYLVPWASHSETSFVENIDLYRTTLNDTGFEVISHRNRAQFAISSRQCGRISPIMAHLRWACMF